MSKKIKSAVFEPGSTIFEKGDKGDVAYLIAKGVVEIRTNVRGENPVTLGRRESGDVIGEMALFDDEPRMATAIAIEKTELLIVSHSDFKLQVDKMPPVIKSVVVCMAQRLREAGEDMVIQKTQAEWANWRPKN